MAKAYKGDPKLPGKNLGMQVHRFATIDDIMAHIENFCVPTGQYIGINTDINALPDNVYVVSFDLFELQEPMQS